MDMEEFLEILQKGKVFRGVKVGDNMYAYIFWKENDEDRWCFQGGVYSFNMSYECSSAFYW